MPINEQFLRMRKRPKYPSTLPIGSIYMNASDSTNPATLLGYGTWVAIQDAMIIGASGTYSAGTTGGSSTTTQTSSQLASHTHVTNGGTSNTTSNTGRVFSTGPYSSTQNSTYTSTATGSGSAMTTISPYYSAYIWRRTA